MKNKKLILIPIILVLVFLGAGALTYFFGKENSKVPYVWGDLNEIKMPIAGGETERPQEDRNPIVLDTILSNKTDLGAIFKALEFEGKLRRCGYYDRCFNNIISGDTAQQIALKYKIIDDVEASSKYTNDIRIGLLQGGSVDIPGIGIGYEENKKALKLDSTEWYWEIGACSTNKRIYINAITGQSSLLHTYVYCGGTL